MAREWIIHVAGENNPDIKTKNILCKYFKDGSHCEAVISQNHPLIIKFSKSQENIKVSINYGHWNVFGVAQHVL